LEGSPFLSGFICREPDPSKYGASPFPIFGSFNDEIEYRCGVSARAASTLDISKELPFKCIQFYIRWDNLLHAHVFTQKRLDNAPFMIYNMTMNMTMDILLEEDMHLTKSAVKARILEYFRYVETTGEEIVVTDHGKPSVKICPIRKGDSVAEVFSEYRGKVEVKGDLTGPTSGEWETT
jgi:prevent-host-death family protein